ncbi:hypothetical protein [Spirosoma migulaei]
MANVRLLGRLFLLVMVGSVSCTKNNLNIPEPAPTIAGTYQLLTTNARLPIQGDNLTLTIQSVTNNTVGIVLRSSLNGQAVDSLTYQKVAVEQNFDSSLFLGATAISVGCISYAIYLSPQKTTDLLKMTCSEKNVMYYYYTPAGQMGVTLIKFKKV